MVINVKPNLFIVKHGNGWFIGNLKDTREYISDLSRYAHKMGYSHWSQV